MSPELLEGVGSCLSHVNIASGPAGGVVRRSVQSACIYIALGLRQHIVISRIHVVLVSGSLYGIFFSGDDRNF